MISAIRAIGTAIKEFFNLVVTLFDFVFGLIQDLLKVVQLLAEAILQIPTYLNAFFPSAFISIFMIIISIVVIYKMLGREG